jgi:hypothetical protein
MKMFTQVVNVASSVAFIAVLSALIWWLRTRAQHWSSEDGTRCICQMTLALTSTTPKWVEARIVIDKANAVACVAHRFNRFVYTHLRAVPQQRQRCACHVANSDDEQQRQCA